MKLSDGEIVGTKRLDNGALEAFILGKPEMTNQQWLEYTRLSQSLAHLESLIARYRDNKISLDTFKTEMKWTIQGM